MTLPGNDPDVASWLVTLLEVAAALSASLVVVSRRRTRERLRLFWAAVAVITVVMAVNKQADFQHTLSGRVHAALSAEEWAQLRPAAFALLVALLVIAGIPLLALLVWAGSGSGPELIAGTGVLVLLAFSALRTYGTGLAGGWQSRFGHDELLPLEALGASAVFAGALWQLARDRRDRASSLAAAG